MPRTTNPMKSPRSERIDPPSILSCQNLDREAFMVTLSSLMQPFELHCSSHNLFNLTAVSTESLSLMRVQSRSGFSIHTEPNPIPYKLDLPLAPGFRDVRSDTIFLPGQWAYIPRQGDAVQLDLGQENRGYDMLCLILLPQALREYALLVDPDREIVSVAEDRRLRLSTSIGQSFQRYLLYAYREMLANPALFESSILLHEFQSTLLAMVLELLPRRERTHTAPGEVPEFAGRQLVRSAEELIRAHLGEPLSIGRISAMLGVRSRTLHKAFRRHLNTTPMAYVKKRRLEMVRRELLAGDPHCHTITQLASRWGFNNPGHFSVDYRKAFGECPSATLRRRSGS